MSIDAETLDFAPVLRAVGRVSAGSENIDLEACERRQVEVVRSLTASARAEAEFVIGAMLSLLRRVPVRAARRLGRRPRARRRDDRPGRHAAVGAHDRPAARRLRRHASSATTRRCTRPIRRGPTGRSRHAGLREIVERADVLCVQLDYFSRYHGLLGDRFLRHCKPSQVVVSTAHSRLFDEAALAAALKSGRIAAAWLDSVEPGALDPHRPLARHRDAAGHAAGRLDDARVAPAQRLGGGAPDRRAARGAVRRRPPTSSRRFQARSLISKPTHCRRELGDPALLLIDDGRGRAADEALVAELGVRLGDLAVEPIDLLA